MPPKMPTSRSLLSVSRFRRLRSRTAAACLVLALLSACDGQAPQITAPATALPEIRDFVTEDAARHLNSKGYFTFNTVAPSAGVPTITPERAGELALANVRTYAPFFQRGWEKDRGGPIDIRSLEVDPRIFFAETPYAVFPEGFHPAYRRSYGPYYLVRLVSGTTPVLLVAVSAYSTDVHVGKGGTVSLPAVGGDEFFELPISASPATGFRPVLPEEAVEQVWRRAGARTAKLPELLLRGSNYNPGIALWRMSLDREIQVKSATGNRRLATRTVYVGPTGRLFVPAVTQPSSERGMFRTGPPWNSSAKAPAEIQIRTGRPAAFVEVVVDAEGS